MKDREHFPLAGFDLLVNRHGCQRPTWDETLKALDEKLNICDGITMTACDGCERGVQPKHTRMVGGKRLCMDCMAATVDTLGAGLEDANRLLRDEWMCDDCGTWFEKTAAHYECGALTICTYCASARELEHPAHGGTEGE